MKVLMVNHFPLTGSGSGVYTTNIANSLTKLGHEVCCIYPDNAPDANTWRFKTHPVLFNSEQADFNFPCFTTHPRSNTTFDDLTELQLKTYLEIFEQAISREIDEFKPDIIHCGHIWLLADVAEKFDRAVVITSHGTDLMGIKNSERFRDNAISAARGASAIISISKGNLSELKSTLPEFEEKFHLISNGYNTDVFYPEDTSVDDVLKMFDISGDYKKIVSFAGKFAHFKGIDVLLHANAIYDRSDICTILAGDGELFQEMTELKDELGLRNTFFVHNQPHDKLRKLYSAATVSLVPSRNEPFGLVAIEAGACGAPIVGSRSGGLIDIIKPETGIFFEQDNAEELANCVNSILDERLYFERDEVAEVTRKTFAQGRFTQQMIDEVYRPALD